MTPTTDQAAREAVEKMTVKPRDKRPARLGWAPGGYLATCGYCSCRFIGDKRASNCADCAYHEFTCDCGWKWIRGDSGAHDCVPQYKAALAEERLRREETVVMAAQLAQERDSLAAEAERLRNELKEIWSAAFVDPDEISETMARNIVRVIRDAADKALKPQL